MFQGNWQLKESCSAARDKKTLLKKFRNSETAFCEGSEAEEDVELGQWVEVPGCRNLARDGGDDGEERTVAKSSVRLDLARPGTLNNHTDFITSQWT